MKIAVIGVGSFVFGPSVLHDAIVHHQFRGVHLALFDPNQQGMQLMAAVGQRMADEIRLPIAITCHDAQAQAIDGADFVVSSAAVQVQKRFATDCRIISEIYPEHLVTEFGGVAGISCTLRQIALLRGLAADMLQMCPKAWLLTSSNPLPRVCQAVHQEGVKVVGFCANSSQVFDVIGRVMLGIHETFPWPEASSRFEVEMAGVNHFTWLARLTERSTGIDRTREFTAKLLRGEGGIAQERPMTMDLLRSYGLYPPNGDDHMTDFIAPTGQVPSLESSSHGTLEEREVRLRLLGSVATGAAPYRQIMGHRAWEMPMDFVAGMAQGIPVRFNSLNLANVDRQLPQLPEHVFVETAARVEQGRLIPTTHVLPDKIASLCSATAEVSHALVSAACRRSRSLLARAVELDPTILDKKRGMLAVAACMQAHADLIGSW